jgi:hypothetical protein
MATPPGRRRLGQHADHGDGERRRRGEQHRPEDRRARGERRAGAAEAARDPVDDERGEVEEERREKEVAEEMRADGGGDRLVGLDAAAARMARGTLATKRMPQAAIR